MSQKIKFPYKVTPPIDKQIIEVSKHLPPIQKLDVSGKPILKPVSVPVLWKDLTEEEKKQFPKPQYYGGKFSHVERPFRRTTHETVFEDHYLKLYWKYREFGEQGVTDYVREINDISIASQKAAENIAAQN